jgi:hypothetical protein
MNAHRLSLICLLATLGASLYSSGAQADNFARVHYDKQADRLVVTMVYRGTNPDHKFSLKWGECQAAQAGSLPGVTVEVLDDQFDDQAQQDFKKTVHFDLAGLPCPRPAAITLRTAPRFFYTLTIPAG